MALMLVLSLAAIVSAQQVPPGEICNANGDLGVSHDACVTCIVAESGRGGPGTIANCICKYYNDDLSFAGGPSGNHGACVNFVKSSLLP